jgi:hypothetical protein
MNFNAGKSAKLRRLAFTHLFGLRQQAKARLQLGLCSTSALAIFHSLTQSHYCRRRVDAFILAGGNSLCSDVGTAAVGQAARPAAIALYRSLRFAPDELQPPRYKGTVSDDPSDTSRQEQQIGRFLSIFEERLARRAYLRPHGQPAG